VPILSTESRSPNVDMHSWWENIVDKIMLRPFMEGKLFHYIFIELKIEYTKYNFTVFFKCMPPLMTILPFHFPLRNCKMTNVTEIKRNAGDREIIYF
jgi:hypothetical protein